MDTVDLVVIGAGIAGMAAALEAKEKGLSTIIIEKAMPGGKLYLYQTIRPDQGIEETSSVAFASLWHEKLEKASITITYDQVLSIQHKGMLFHITLSNTFMTAKTVIIATGYRDKPLLLEGADRFLGQGLSYCAACDGGFFKGKNVAALIDVFTNLDEVRHLKAIVGHLTVLCIPQRREIEAATLKILESIQDADIYFGVTPISLEGDSQLESMYWLDQGETRAIKISALFPFLGTIANTEFMANLVSLERDGFIVTDKKNQTNIEKIYAIGDVKSNGSRLLISAIEEARQVVSTIKKL